MHFGQEHKIHPEDKGTLIHREVVPLPHEAPPEPEGKGNLARIAETIVDKISGGVETVIEMIHEATAKPGGEPEKKKRDKKRKKWEAPHILHPLPPVVNYVSLYQEKPPKRKSKPRLEPQLNPQEQAPPNAVSLEPERLHQKQQRSPLNQERSPLKRAKNPESSLNPEHCDL